VTRVWIVVPCYNEEDRLPVAAIQAFLKDHPVVSLCLVDDGSEDGTRAVLERLAAACPGQVSVLAPGRNQGKGEAVRQGVLLGLEKDGAAELFGFWDADLSTPLSELAPLVNACTSSPAHIAAIGSRIKRLGARVTRRAARHYFGRVFATFASITLRLPVYDSQCGAKIFRRDAAAVAFAGPFVSRWLFDVELLARLRNHYRDQDLTETIVEVPLGVWTDIGASKVRLWHFLLAPVELWRIARMYNRR
jgi:glycosyltransferase involved in cell wall biosynthesis